MSRRENLQVTISGELVASLNYVAEEEFAGDVCAALKHSIATLKFLSDQEVAGNKIYLHDSQTNEDQRLLLTPDDFSRWEEEF